MTGVDTVVIAGIVAVAVCCFGLMVVVMRRRDDHKKEVEEEEVTPYEQCQRNEENKADGVAPQCNTEMTDIAEVSMDAEAEADASAWTQENGDYDPYAQNEEEYAAEPCDGASFNPLALPLS